MQSNERNYSTSNLIGQPIELDSFHGRRSKFGRESTYEQLPPNEVQVIERHHGHRTVLKTWWAEIVCSLGVVIALLAIAVTLATHQGQPVQQWPWKFSINSLVSAYSVVLKGAMLIIISTGISQLKWIWFKTVRSLSDIDDWDQASRGVWGSLILIWRLRGRHLTATLGAIVTIFALAVDPMIQFLVRYDNCDIQQFDHVAQMARSSTFLPIGDHIGAHLNLIPPNLINVITAGLFDPETETLEATCPTGNCTFSQPYHSLGYCGQCEDVSSQLSLKCGDYTKYYPINYGNGTIANSSYLAHRCNYSLPNGPANVFDTTGNQQSYFLIEEDFEDFKYLMITNNLTFWNNNTLFTGDTSNPHRFENCTTTSSESSWICAGAGAASCTFKPCIRSFMTNITNGKQQENLTSVFTAFNMSYDEKYGDYGYSAVDISCLSNDTRQQLINLHYPITKSTGFVGWRGNGFNYDSTGEEPDNSLPNVTIPDGCLYRLYSINDMSINYYLRTLLSGNVTGGEDSSSGYIYDTSGPPAPTKLFNGGNISFESVNTTFSNIGVAMSIYMRTSQAGQAGNYPANGTVWREEICIGVRWTFLVLPVVLVALTLLFFVMMIVETSTRLQGVDWKDSALALMFHGIYQDGEAGPQRPTMELHTKDSMSFAARNMDVRLGRDAGEKELFFTVTK